MKEIYVVEYETNDDGDIESGVLGHRFYTDRDAARRAMIRDFDQEKAEFDDTDDTDESHDLDSCALSANHTWSKKWDVVGVSDAGEPEDADVEAGPTAWCDACVTEVPLDGTDHCMCCGRLLRKVGK